MDKPAFRTCCYGLGEMVELKPHEIPENEKLIHAFYKIYKCQTAFQHENTYVCREDGSHQNKRVLKSHVYDNLHAEKLRSLGGIFMGSKKRVVWMQMHFALKIIPHLYCLKIDYTDPFDEMVEDYCNERGWLAVNYIDISHPYYPKVIEFIEQQPVECPICGCMFDSFPCVKLATNHITHCSVLLRN